jgi:hypothetical protein
MSYEIDKIHNQFKELQRKQVLSKPKWLRPLFSGYFKIYNFLDKNELSGLLGLLLWLVGLFSFYYFAPTVYFGLLNIAHLAGGILLLIALAIGVFLLFCYLGYLFWRKYLIEK